MFKKKGFLVIIICLLILLGMVVFFNQPKQLPFPFAGPIELLPDYRPPMEGVTLYPTGGPFGFDIIETIAVSPSGTLFVGTYGGGLFRSEDGGEHWLPSNMGLQDKFIASLIALKEGKVFAATVRAGLFQSLDNGAHWSSASRGLDNIEIHTMLLRSSGEILAGTGQGAYITRDGGRSWETFNKGLSDIPIQSIVETKDKTLFAATQGRGIFKRTFVGEKWLSVVHGFAFEELEERVVRALVLGRDEALFAGTMSAGIFRSLDGGEKWQSANRGLGNHSIRTLSADGAGNLYAGTGEGVYFSENDGAQWFPLLEGMKNIQIHSFAVNDAGDLYAGSAGGIYRGRIRMAWESLHDELLISPVLSLDFGEEGVTVGTYGKGTYVNLQDNWVSDNLGLVNLSILEMARGKTYLYAITNGGVYRRQLGRHRWEPIRSKLAGDPITLGVDSNDRLYIGSTRGLFSSSDQGQRWEQEEEIGSFPVTSLTINGATIMAATENNLWSKHPESGWEKIITKEGSAFQHILWRPERGLLAVSDNKIWERDLDGIWRELNGDLPEGIQIRSMATDPHNSGILYIGTKRGLIWSLDNGAAWHKARLYQGNVFEGQVNQILPTNTSAIWLATEADGAVLGISRIARRNFLQRWLDKS